jgi:NADPH:quinone reductase-like Zn-dependent oxidoreductase
MVGKLQRLRYVERSGVIMKTYEIEAFGLEALACRDRDVPKPGPGEVLVRMQAFSLNYRDLRVVQGLYNPKMRLPMVPLSDGTGEVAEVGSGVSRFKSGDRVAGIFMQDWIEGELDDAKWKSALGGGIQGVASEYCLFRESGLVPVPDYLTPEEAATLPCAAVTAWNALFESSSLRPGDTLLTLGTGGVSIFALQLARLAGARVIITSSRKDKLAKATELGANDAINYAENEDWDKAVREITGGRGVDHVIEVGGAGTLAKSLKAVRTAGTISLIGVLTHGAQTEVNPAPVLMRHLRVQGIYVGSRQMFEHMLRALTLHRVKPVVDRVFDFVELRDAMAYMQSAAHVGKICLRVR